MPECWWLSWQGLTFAGAVVYHEPRAGCDVTPAIEEIIPLPERVDAEISDTGVVLRLTENGAEVHPHGTVDIRFAHEVRGPAHHGQQQQQQRAQAKTIVTLMEHFNL